MYDLTQDNNNEYILIIKDELFPDGDCKIFGNDLDSLRQEGIENIRIDPGKVTAKIHVFERGEIGKAIVDCNWSLENK